LNHAAGRLEQHPGWLRGAVRSRWRTGVAAAVISHSVSRQVRLSRRCTPRMRLPDGKSWVGAGTARRGRARLASRPRPAECCCAGPPDRWPLAGPATTAPPLCQVRVAESYRAQADAADRDSSSRWCLVERHVYLFWRTRFPLWSVFGAAGWLITGWLGVVLGLAAAILVEVLFGFRRLYGPRPTTSPTPNR